jgi:hypoxanthine phosphoribosyltransferase
MKEKIIYTKEMIAERVKEIGKSITKEYTSNKEELVLVCVLYGAVLFFSDLIRNIDLPITIDFVRAESYGPRMKSSGVVNITKDIENNITNKQVILVEDIIDSGLTITNLIEHFEQKNPDSIQICSLINKTERRDIPIDIDYSGFKLKEGFVVGYGLDYNQKMRNLADIYLIEEED